MDFDPAEIRRMMEKRQRELRGHRAAIDDVLSPSKRSRQEKENGTGTTRSPQKGESVAGKAVSPAKTSSSVRARLNEVSKRLAQFEDDLPKRSTASESLARPGKKERESPPTLPKPQIEKCPSAKLSEEPDTPEKIPSVTICSTLTTSKLVPLGKIVEKVPKCGVDNTPSRCEIDAKPMASVSARAKFFERAMEADKIAAAAIRVPVGRRSSKLEDRDEKPANKKVSLQTEVNPSAGKTPDELSQSLTTVTKSSDHGDVVADVQLQVTMTEPEQEPAQRAQSEPKKVGSVSSKLKTHLQNLMAHGHQTLDDTLMSISERVEERPPVVPSKSDGEMSELRPDTTARVEASSPLTVEESREIQESDADTSITEIPEDKHSTPKHCVSVAETLETPTTRIVSLNHGDENEAHHQRTGVEEPRADPMQDIRQDKEGEEHAERTLECHKRDIENQVSRQESLMKQFSHALKVCQDRGDQGSKEHLEAERFLLIATQRRKLAQTELQRINAEGRLPQKTGTLAISRIKLPFKNEFLELLRQYNNILEKTHYFMALVRSGDSLVHTGLVSSNDEILERSACFDDSPGLFLDLQEDFKVVVEVYAVQASNLEHPDCRAAMERIRREKEKESKKGGGILSVLTPSKRKKAQNASQVEEVKIRRPSFGLIGRVTLDENLITRDERWYRLSDFYEDSPLDGRIHMKLQLTVPERVHHCGTLRLNEGFISSYFAAIEGSYLNLYKDMRSAEENQEPLRCFELSQAVDIVCVEQIIGFYYFPLKLSDGVELRFLTYSEDESNEWALKLNAQIKRTLKK